MNPIQKLSHDLRTQQMSEALGLDPAERHSGESVRQLWHEERLAQLKQTLRRQFASNDPVREASDFLFYSNE